MANFNGTDNNKVEMGITSIPENERTVENQNNTHVNFFKQFLLPRVYITAIISFIVIIAVNIANSIILKNVFNVTTNTNEEELEELKKINPVAMTIYACIIDPIIEELIFRRLIFWLIKKLSLILAYLVSSFIFAIAHFSFSFETLISEIHFFPIYFIIGVVLAYTYDYDGYILASMISHILNNTTAAMLPSI